MKILLVIWHATIYHRFSTIDMMVVKLNICGNRTDLHFNFYQRELERIKWRVRNTLTELLLSHHELPYQRILGNCILPDLANDVHCNFMLEALMNTISSYEAAYWLERISYNFLIWYGAIIVNWLWFIISHWSVGFQRFSYWHRWWRSIL